MRLILPEYTSEEELLTVLSHWCVLMCGLSPCQGSWSGWPLCPPPQGLGIYVHDGVRDRSLERGGARMKGGWKVKREEGREAERRDVALWRKKTSDWRLVHANAVWLTYTHTLTHKDTLSPAATYGPHVEKAAAQERVHAPMYVGQTGDVEDFMPEAGRQQEEEVQRPVPHLVTRPTTVLHMKCKHHGTSCLQIMPGCLSDQIRPDTPFVCGISLFF